MIDCADTTRLSSLDILPGAREPDTTLSISEDIDALGEGVVWRLAAIYENRHNTE